MIDRQGEIIASRLWQAIAASTAAAGHGNPGRSPTAAAVATVNPIGSAALGPRHPGRDRPVVRSVGVNGSGGGRGGGTSGSTRPARFGMALHVDASGAPAGAGRCRDDGRAVRTVL